MNDRYKRILAREKRPSEEVLDGVYDKFARSNPFLPVTHFTDHATMGPEALVGLGLGSRVEQWISRHHPRPYAPPLQGVAIATYWAAAIGRPECHGDWMMRLEDELRAEDHVEVLKRWVPRFAHQVGTSLFHGLIRTAHAVRALDHRDTPARRGELARGLAFWAIGVKVPPGSDPSHSVEVSAPEAAIGRCARAGAAAFINDPSIPNVHLVTGPMAYLLLAHHLDARVHSIAVASFARTHAQALSSFAAAEKTARAVPLASLDDSQLERLARQTDAHPAKLTEAALRAYELTDDELFLKAAGRMQDSTTAGRILRTARALVMGRMR